MRLLAALERQPLDRPPVWFMRQAGRYLPEYRQIRETHTFEESMTNPGIAAEITLQPLRRFSLDAAIVFAPVGALVPAALRQTRKGGRVVCGGIHMSDIPSFPYADLWGERRIESVANLTREDGELFMQTAGRLPLRTEVTPYPLGNANQALDDLRNGRLSGAAVLLP